MLKRKKLVVLVLTLSMLVGSISVGTAASGSSSLGRYTAYYDAYCGSSSGDASTYLYVDGYVTGEAAYVSMSFYTVDIDIWNNTTNVDTLNNEMVLFGTDSDSSSENNSGQVIADVEVYCGNGAHGWKVESEHSASATYDGESYNPGQSLTAYY